MCRQSIRYVAAIANIVSELAIAVLIKIASANVSSIIYSYQIATANK